MILNEKQSADLAQLRGYYPYRLFFLVQEGAADAEVWALRDRRAVNQAIRRGAQVWEERA